MALILFGLPLPASKSLLSALPLLYGIGPSRSRELCRHLGFPPSLCVGELTPAQEYLLSKTVKEDYTVAGNLTEERKADIHRLFSNGCQRGSRLRIGLPVRGQRTRSNSKTARRIRASLFYTR